jgi:hypothetical protein
VTNGSSAIHAVGTRYFATQHRAIGLQARSKNCEKRLLALSCLSARMEQVGSHLTDFHEIWRWAVLENLSGKFKYNFSLTRMTDTAREDTCTFMIICRWILLAMRNVTDKTYWENQNAQFMSNSFFPSRKWCRLWDNVEKYCTAGQDTDNNMAMAHFMLYT